MAHWLRHTLHRLAHRRRYALLAEMLAAQRLDATGLQARQQAAFRRIVNHAAANTDFYAERFAGLCSLGSDFSPAELPVLSKRDVIENRERMLSRTIDRQMVKEGHTGGSTGQPLTFYYDQDKHERMLAGMLRGFMMSGWRPGQRILYLWGAARDTRRGAVLGGDAPGLFSMERSLAAIDYTPVRLAEWLTIIEGWQPALLYGYASALGELARFMLERGWALRHSLLAVYSTAEPLDAQQRELMEQAFGCKVFDQYGCREVPNIAWECRHGNRHVFSDLVLLESLPVDGEDRLLVTSLTDRTMPFIRYELGDTGTLQDGECACGSPFPMMAMGACRQNDLVRLRDGRRVHPAFFNGLLYGRNAIQQYQWVQHAVDELCLNLVCRQRLGREDEQAIRRRVADELDPQIRLEFAYVDEIARTPVGKHRFVIGLPDADPR